MKAPDNSSPAPRHALSIIQPAEVPGVAHVTSASSVGFSDREKKLRDLGRTDPAQALVEADAWLASADSRQLTEESARARRARAIALRFLGRYEESADEFVRCKQDFKSAGLELEDFRTNSGYVFTLRYLGRYAEAIELAE